MIPVPFVPYIPVGKNNPTVSHHLLKTEKYFFFDKNCYEVIQISSGKAIDHFCSTDPNIAAIIVIVGVVALASITFFLMADRTLKSLGIG